jgi:hypothetical protein
MTDDPEHKQQHSGPTPQRVTQVDLYVFGSADAPRAPRAGGDFNLAGEDHTIPAGVLPLPHGASAFSDPLVNEKPEGHYHLLPKGTLLPEGLAVVRDDATVVQGSPNPKTHHTVFPTTEMSFTEFCAKFVTLPWQYAGKKRRP